MVGHFVHINYNTYYVKQFLATSGLETSSTILYINDEILMVVQTLVIYRQSKCLVVMLQLAPKLKTKDSLSLVCSFIQALVVDDFSSTRQARGVCYDLLRFGKW